jgi:hypothetical protein
MALFATTWIAWQTEDARVDQVCRKAKGMYFLVLFKLRIACLLHEFLFGAQMHRRVLHQKGDAFHHCIGIIHDR